MSSEKKKASNSNEMNIEENQEEQKEIDPFSGLDEFIMNKRIEPVVDKSRQNNPQDEKFEDPMGMDDVIDVGADMQLHDFMNQMDCLIQGSGNNFNQEQPQEFGDGADASRKYPFDDLMGGFGSF